MDNEYVEVGNLQINTKTDSDYSGRAAEFRKHSMDLGKWLLTMLVFASGSAFTLVILQILKITQTDPNYWPFLICAWLFAVSLCFSFYGVVSYTNCIIFRNEELNARGNKQDMENSINSILQIITDAVGNSEEFKGLSLDIQREKIFDERFLISQLSSNSQESFFQQQASIGKITTEIENYFFTANKRYKYFQISMSISFFAFSLGILVPLLFFTYKGFCNGV